VDGTNQVKRTVTQHHQPLTLQARLHRTLVLVHRARSVVHFFGRHRSLLRSKEHGVVARKTLVRAKTRLARAMKEIKRLRHAIWLRRLRVLQAASPKEAICQVFHGYCREAVSVAWCESRLRPTAQNGQYLGLFQMGSLARQLFGHGQTARAQAIAAHKYFLYSGRDWSPWSCKPSY
jgi:hypothetical protein